MEKYVYHASSVSGLKEILPQRSTHHEVWLYATKDIVMSAVFLGTLGGDLTCQVGRDRHSGLPYVCERFQGAFEKRYSGVKGSIYSLPASEFKEDKTSWGEEVICSHAVSAIKELKIENAKDYLFSLAENGELIINFYPDRVVNVPDDDSDLVQKCIIWTRQAPEFILEVEKYHPGLMERVKAGLGKRMC